MKLNKKELAPFFSIKLVLYMMFIAGVLATLLFALKVSSVPFWHYFIYAQSVAICQSLCMIGLFYILKIQQYQSRPWIFLVQTFSGIFLGSIIGFQVGALLTGNEGFFALKGIRGAYLDVLVGNILIGVLVTTAFAIRSKVFLNPETPQEKVERVRKLMFRPRYLFILILLNTLIAYSLYSIGYKNQPFISLFIVSQCIGFSISFFIGTGFYFFGAFHPIIPSIGGVVTGSIVGTFIGFILVGKIPLAFNREIDVFARSIILGLLFGVIGTTYFYIRAQLSATQLRVEQERAKRIQDKKETVETSLKLLQAQIEPHFLFNTLSNILSLLNTDVEKGKAMLVDLTQYLRTSLTRTRSDRTTLGQEMEMIQAYLGIFKIRLGERLCFDIELPEKLKSFPFPSMLIQPLVENSIKHGIEPKIEGGNILISAEQSPGVLTLVVADTGKGLNIIKPENAGENRVGLKNIRNRLASLYGTAGRLTLKENSPTGVKAVIEVPYEP